MNRPDLSQNTLLHYVTATGNAELTVFFLSDPLSNKFINHQNKDRRTPLHLAVIHTHIPCIDLLLENPEIDLNVPDFKSWTPLHYTISLGNSETTRCLLMREELSLILVTSKLVTSVVIAVEKKYTGSLRVKYKLMYVNRSM